MHSSTEQFKPARTREEMDAQTNQMQIALKATAQHRQSLAMQNLMRNTSAAAGKPKASPTAAKLPQSSRSAPPSPAAHALPPAGRHFKRLSWWRRLLGN